MKKNKNGKFIFPATAVFVFVTIFCSVFHVVENEGFNPSDEGVILAQSYRIIHGEIPHQDFISIRPAGSGYLHAVHFISPLPLIASGRWLTILEYFIYSSCWVFLITGLIRSVTNRKLNVVLLAGLLLLTFSITVHIKHIYPWTTVDALFFAAASSVVLFRQINFNNYTIKNYGTAIWAIILMSVAVLCRQTFVMPLGIYCLFILLAGFRTHQIFKSILACLIGGLPVFIYLIFLGLNGALIDFARQMSGRTELFRTGIVEYGIKFFITPWLVLYLIYGFLIINLIFRKRKFSERILLRFDAFIMILIFALAIFTFLNEYQSTIPFVFFWTCAFFTCRLLLLPGPREIIALSIITLLLAWTSSISLGDNTPVFCSGLLFITIMTQIYCLHADKLNISHQGTIRKLSFIILFISASAFSLMITGQKQFNYRDLAGNELTQTLSDHFPEMGHIKVNQITRNYFDTMMQLKNQLNIPAGQFVVLPNNAAIYPLLDSRNPFPIDWVQQNEYIGAKEKLHEDIRAALNDQLIYIFIDKIDSKYMFDGVEPFKPDLTFNHEYLPLILESCRKLDSDNVYFDVYVSK